MEQRLDKSTVESGSSSDRTGVGIASIDMHLGELKKPFGGSRSDSWQRGCNRGG